MKAAKHMELIFIAALALASVSTLARASVAAPRVAQRATVTAINGSVQAPREVTMTVVTVHAKRLSAAQKAALVN